MRQQRGNAQIGPAHARRRVVAGLDFTPRVEGLEADLSKETAPISAPPFASALMGSLRGVGYSTEAAVADLVDNSISAGARHVWLDMTWDGQGSHVTLLDDGAGMGVEQLTEAMRLGSADPTATRLPGDLGRFGLGLKTASFSQCRVLTVASKRRGSTAIGVRRWDLDYVAKVARDWTLLSTPKPGSEKLLDLLQPLESGTLVVWEDLDRLVERTKLVDRKAQELFLEIVERTARHLAMVFHRFLDSSSPTLSLFVNGRGNANRLTAWDPFLSQHPATIRRPQERLEAGQSEVEVQAFVLPHKDRLSGREFANAGGAEGWTAHQGFYVYRNRRLLVPGSWLGLGVGGRVWTKEEQFKLARIRLDFRNDADSEWDIDVKKSRAKPPAALRPRLQAIAADARDWGRRVFIHRGMYGPREASPRLVNVWLSSSGASGVRYRIDRSHPVVAGVLQTAGAHQGQIEVMLDVIEQSVPVQRIWLEASEQASEVPASADDMSVERLRPVLSGVWGYLRNTVGLPRDQAMERLLGSEPFNAYPELVQAVIMELEGDDAT